MHRNGLAAAALVAAVGAAGCLVKETTHRLYLSPSGAVAWAVLEESVRSNENDRLKRTTEEQEWLDSVAMSTHSVAEGLRRLGTDQTSTTLLRPARPYMALTDARFAHVDRVIARLFEELGLRGEATLTAGRQETTLSVALDLSSLDNPGPEPESPVGGATRGPGPLPPRADRGPIRLGHRFRNPGRRNCCDAPGDPVSNPGSSWCGESEARVAGHDPKPLPPSSQARRRRPRPPSSSRPSCRTRGGSGSSRTAGSRGRRGRPWRGRRRGTPSPDGRC